MELMPYQLDELRELMNIATGRAAASLARLLNKRVHIQVLQVRVLDKEATRLFLTQELGLVGSAVEQGFHGDISGAAVLLLPRDEAIHLVRFLTGESRGPETLSTEEEAILAEVGNIVLNACIGTITNLLKTQCRIEVPQVFYNLPGEHLARLLTEVIGPAFHALVLSSTLRVGEEEITFYALLVLAISEADLHYMLDHLETL